MHVMAIPKQACNPRLRWLAVTSGLLLLLSFPHQDAHADTLPSIVTSGYTMSMDDVVGSGGTTLNVPAMLLSASVAGNTTAIFTASGLEFQGTLTIVCPDASTGWSNVMLRVSVLGSTNTAIAPSSPLFSITGILSQGSLIAILKGVFNNNQVIHLGSGFTVQGSSSVEVTDTKQTIMPGISGGEETCLVCTKGPLTISDNGRVAIANNKVVAGMGVWSRGSTWYLLHVTFNCPIDISDNSAITIHANTVTADSVTLTGRWIVMYVNSNSPLRISKSSAVSITGNSMISTNLTMAGDQCILFRDSSSPLNISDSSAVSITNNNMTASNTAMTGNWNTMYTGSRSDISLSDHGNLSVTGNIMVATNFSGPYWSANLLYVESASTLTISANSAVSILSNAVSAINVTLSGGILGDWSIYALYTGTDSHFTVTGNSEVSIIDNTVGVHSGNVSWDWKCSMLTSDSMSVIDSDVKVSGNTMSAADVAVGHSLLWRFVTLDYIRGDVVVTDKSTISVTSNTMTYIGSTAPTMVALEMHVCVVFGLLSVVGNEIPQGTVMTIPTLNGSGVVEANTNVVNGAGYVFDISEVDSANLTVRTCMNYVNTTTLCNISDGGGYNCSKGTALDGHISEDCTARTTVPPASSNDSSPSSPNTGLIVGVSIGASIVAVFLVVGAVYLWKMQHGGIGFDRIGDGMPDEEFTVPDSAVQL